MAGASAQPSQRPLLVDSLGAKPNILVSLDDSGSMAFGYPDEYMVKTQGSRNATEGLASFLAQRSSDVNAVYYNPRITYRPRVDASGKPLAVNDGITFVSNATSAFQEFGMFKESDDHLRMGGKPFLIDANFPRYPATTPVPANWRLYYSVFNESMFLPVNIPHGTADLTTDTPPFTYVVCSQGARKDDATSETLCKDANPRIVDVRHNATSSIELPADHKRTDCLEAPAKRCSPKEEIANILNWYRYYRNRLEATKTALGQAFQSDKLSNGGVRIGYRLFNMRPLASGALPELGKDTNYPHFLRGVRAWGVGAANQQFYDWLYGVYPNGGTPTQGAYQAAANYFRAGAGAKENPWARDPSRTSNDSSDPATGNPEMSCRRAYQVVLSDGAWNDVAKLMADAPSSTANQDNVDGPMFTSDPSSGQPARSFAYKPKGLGNDLLSYVPYPGPATGGLADMAAQFYWHEDLRPQLPNDVPTRAGQPTFWQNLRTFAIGYMIRPSGDRTDASSGLKFDQINAYRSQYLLSGFDGAKQPSWPAEGVDLRQGFFNPWPSGTGGDWKFERPETDRVDDFIQSGYTGGGRSFSVRDAEGIRSAIDAILADIFDATGDDAGISLSIATTGSLDGRLKFKVDYRTVDNVGNVTAQRLDQNGNPTLLDQDANGEPLNPKSETYWSAQSLIPAHADRHLYSIGNDGMGFELTGALSNLPSTVRDALRTGNHAANLPEDRSFVDYLRGKDPVTDTKGQIYRLRVSRMGAIVNSAPLLLGAAPNHGYEDAKSTVTGKEGYASFRQRVAMTPDTLFAATNAGVVHALDATSGREIAAYMPRRSMRHLLDQAQNDGEFRYVLDGPLTHNDVYDGSAWNQLVVGSGGRGERVVYALRPRLDPQGETQLGASDYLWETGPDLIDTTSDGDNAAFASGHMTNPARSGQTDSGEWVVVLNSGHYNGHNGNRHGLVVLNALTGAVLRTIALPTGYSAGRGLGGVTLVRDARKRVVAAYAGDANGNLWRFDLRGNPANWKVSYGKPLFTTENNRPIYAAPAWQAHPKGGLMVVAATGILLEEGDASDTTRREAIYGIWDPTSRIDGAEAVSFQTISYQQLLEQKVEQLKASVGDNSYYAISRNKIAWEGADASKGWKLLLGGRDDRDHVTHAGERVVEQVANAGSSVVISSVVINRGASHEEKCTASRAPDGAVYVLNALDGAGRRAFDHDGDGQLDEASMVYLVAGGYARGIVLTSATPEASMTRTQKSELHVATANGEGVFDNATCRSSRINIVGVNGGFLAAGSECPVTTWSRQQYQLTRLPQ